MTPASGAANRVVLSARMARTDGLRHTPGGLPTLRLWLVHESAQREAGRERQVVCEVEAVGFGEVATALSRCPADRPLTVTGFLDRKGLRQPQPILHVTEFELHQE